MAEMISREAYLAAAEATKDKLQTTLRQLEHQQTDSRREVSSLVSRTETALSELAAAILTDLSSESVDAAVALTGCRTLAMVNPATELTKAQNKLKAQLAERSQQISARTAEISELPIFQNRLLLRAPRTGTSVLYPSGRSLAPGWAGRAIVRVPYTTPACSTPAAMVSIRPQSRTGPAPSRTIITVPFHGPFWPMTMGIENVKPVPSARVPTPVAWKPEPTVKEPKPCPARPPNKNE